MVERLRLLRPRVNFRLESWVLKSLQNASVLSYFHELKRLRYPLLPLFAALAEVL